MKATWLILLFISLLMVGLILTGCTPVYVDRKVEVPITIPCKILLPKLATLPSDEPMPAGLSVKQKRDWMLSALYRDIVLQKGEIDSLEKIVTSCQ
jgi:hypothetical protein